MSTVVSSRDGFGAVSMAGCQADDTVFTLLWQTTIGYPTEAKKGARWVSRYICVARHARSPAGFFDEEKTAPGYHTIGTVDVVA